MRRYIDDGPYYDVSVRSQAYYVGHGMSTRVKACANRSVDEVIALTGISAFTIMLPDMQDLASKEVDGGEVVDTLVHPTDISYALERTNDFVYLENEARFRCDFASAASGRNQYRVMQVSMNRKKLEKNTADCLARRFPSFASFRTSLKSSWKTLRRSTTSRARISLSPNERERMVHLLG
jgi:hypothetical protein